MKHILMLNWSFAVFACLKIHRPTIMHFLYWLLVRNISLWVYCFNLCLFASCLSINKCFMTPSANHEIEGLITTIFIYINMLLNIKQKVYLLKGAVSWKIHCLVLISVKHHIKIDGQSDFSFSITCLVLQIFTVLRHVNDVIHSRILNTSYTVQSEKYYSN